MTAFIEIAALTAINLAVVALVVRWRVRKLARAAIQAWDDSWVA